MARIRTPLLVFSLGLVLGLTYIWFFALQNPDGREYQDIARFIAEGKGYIGPGFFKYSVRPTSFLAPVYTYLLAFSFIVFGIAAKNSYLAMYVLQACAFALTAALLYRIIQRYYPGKSAVIFCALYFAYIPLYNTILTIWDTSLLVLLFAAALYVYLEFIERGNIYLLVTLGVLSGLGVLLNPVSAVIIAAVLSHYFIYGGAVRKWKAAAILILLPVLLAAPWTIRNYSVHKTFVPVRTGLGLNLYLGNNANATGTIFLKTAGKVPENFGAGIINNLWPFVVNRWQKTNAPEIQEDKDLTKEFMRFVECHPLDFARLFFVKIFYFWWKNPFQHDPLDQFHKWYAAMLLLAALRIFSVGLKDLKMNLVYLNCIFLTLVYALTGPYFNWKYRFPAEPFLIMCAAIYLGSLRNKYSAGQVFLGTLIPLAGFLNVYFMRIPSITGRFQHLAGMGLIVLFAAAAAQTCIWLSSYGGGTGSRKTVMPAAGAFLLMLGLLIWPRSGADTNVFQACTNANRESPPCCLAHNIRGAALARQGNLDDAIGHYREALRIDPGFAEAQDNWGLALAEQGKAGEAVAHYREALRIKPDFAEAQDNWGVALSGQRRVEEAIAHYREALFLSPAFAEAHYNLGVDLAGQGKLDKAIAHYWAALWLKPDFAEAHNNWGAALARQGKVNEAIVHYCEALRIQPDFAEAHNNWGVSLSGQGKTEEAIAQYREALRLKPEYADAHYNLGIDLAAQEKLGKAAIHYRKALRLKPDLAQVR